MLTKVVCIDGAPVPELESFLTAGWPKIQADFLEFILSIGMTNLTAVRADYSVAPGEGVFFYFEGAASLPLDNSEFNEDAYKLVIEEITTWAMPVGEILEMPDLVAYDVSIEYDEERKTVSVMGMFIVPGGYAHKQLMIDAIIDAILSQV